MRFARESAGLVRPLYAFACALVLPSCAGNDDRERIGRSEHAIIGGAPSSGVEDAVVALVRTGGAGLCTGTLIAPNLVLTARHCVSETDADVECNSEGEPTLGGRAGPDRPPQDLYVIVGTTRDIERPVESAAARGRSIVHDGSKTLCNHDIALVILDRSLEGALTAAPRLDLPVTIGEHFTSIGWGLVETSATPSRRLMRRDVIVGGVGPVAANVSAGSSEFLTGESTCLGDSGGPAMSPDDREVIGVVSRGGNRLPAPFYDPAQSCLGGTGVYTSVAPFRDLIEQARARAKSDASATIATTDWKRSSTAANDETTRAPSCAVSAPGHEHREGAMLMALVALVIASRARARPT
jgi:hypothetical protein